MIKSNKKMRVHVVWKTSKKTLNDFIDIKTKAKANQFEIRFIVKVLLKYSSLK